MPEQDHDRIEEFFRKASLRADVPFNEEDWKKLESRLDAHDGAGIAGKAAGSRIKYGAIAAGVLLLLSVAWVLNSKYGIFTPDKPSTGSAVISGEDSNGDDARSANEASLDSDVNEKLDSDINAKGGDEVEHRRKADNADEGGPQPHDKRVAPAIAADETNAGDADQVVNSGETNDATAGLKANTFGETEYSRDEKPALMDQYASTTDIDKAKVHQHLSRISIANAEKIKQRANVDLPGAEEGDTGEAETTVAEEDASVKQMAPSRLSLLLSFAPDFSSTSSRYSAPGKAFGAMLHYHFFQRWSLSAGVVRNSKRYTGDGEDYTPPKGYWINYTNGVIPSTIDGSCNVLEFPVMLHYTVAVNGKHRLTAGGGTSSYLMMNESYRYNFEEPNPGAREGWDSKRSAKFYFNMIDITLGYERQILPGLMIGVEPYVKIPIEAIGWTNIKLFSTGASVTLRYNVLGRRTTPAPIHSRGPD